MQSLGSGNEESFILIALLYQVKNCYHCAVFGTCVRRVTGIYRFGKFSVVHTKICEMDIGLQLFINFSKPEKFVTSQ